MARSTQPKNSSKVQKVFEDLEKLLQFCKDYGYRYDEADLYSNRSYVWRQYTKFVSGKEVKDQWSIQLERMSAGR